MLYFSDKPENLPVSQLGGKAFNLCQLVKTGFRVPQFLVLTVDAVEKYFSAQPSDLEAVLAPIRTFFSSETMLAVRSSSVMEDGTEHSFAGLFESLLFVKTDQLEAAIGDISRSVNSERVKAYLKQKSISAHPQIAVIVQEMVESEVSGVAFGINPLTGNTESKVINAVFGLGEGLVSGLLDADLYEIETGTIINQHIAEKKQQVSWNKTAGFGTEIVEVSPENVGTPCLKPAQIEDLEKVLDDLKNHFGAPQDIEFAYSDNQLFLLQARPITTGGKAEHEPHIIWDNSNIIESYPGVTLPLTFSFITKMYEAVYRQLSLVMGISQQKINANNLVYANMLGLLKGRVYYNLNSWFGTLSLLPGYALNAAFMEKMMGVKEAFPLKPEVQKSGFSDYIDVVKAISGILRNLFTANQEREKFQIYFQSVMTEYETIDFETKSAHQLVNLYLKFEQTLVKEWKAPLVNDFFAMVFFGLLQKQTQKLIPGKNLQNDLLIGSHDIITTQPAEWTLEIAEMILSHKEATQLFKNEDATVIWKSLNGNQFSNIRKAIWRYLEAWGDRSVGELKLETITFRQRPEDFVQVIKNFVSQGKVTLPDKMTGQRIRQEAEKQIFAALKGSPVSKLIFKFILKKARYFVSNRENLRYERTRGFGMVRRIFLALGKNLASQKLLSHERDIFYLTQEEIFQGMEGKSVNYSWKALVLLRKSEYEAFEKLTLPERIETKGPVQRQMANLAEKKTAQKLDSSVDLQGLGCCAGIVKARIQVVHHPSEVESLKGQILVTSSTDPGWVTLFPSCAGILVERGSLLSHSAIVSREMGIPCVVGISDLLAKVESGWLVEMDGERGTVKILEKSG